jgi:hypothetical protein
MTDSLRREKLQAEGRLLEKQNEVRHLTLKCEGLRDTVRLYMDSLARIEELETELAFEAMTELMAAHLKLTEALGELANIEKVLR